MEEDEDEEGMTEEVEEVEEEEERGPLADMEVTPPPTRR